MAARKSESTIQILDDDHDNDDVSLVYSTIPPPPPPSSSSSSSFPLGTNANSAISVENYNSSSCYYNYNCFYGSNSEPPLKKLKTTPPPSLVEDDAVQLLDDSQPQQLTPLRKSKTTTTFTCEICADERPARLLFKIPGCTHSYCSHCILNYISSRLQDNIVQIRCPVMGCSGLLEPYDCSTILPLVVLERWSTALCESAILDSHKFYCPFKDCSALLLKDEDDPAAATPPPPPTSSSAAASLLITQSECPYCRRLFCAQCKVPWHNEITCQEFQELGKNEKEREDIMMLMNLAKNKKWMMCSRCKVYVERTAGCLFMRCRCGHKFCYKCGATSVTDHYCANCKH